jgi:hypothetical protein
MSCGKTEACGNVKNEANDYVKPRLFETRIRKILLLLAVVGLGLTVMI